MSDFVSDFMAEVMRKNPGETEFHQAVHEVVESLAIVLAKRVDFRKAKVLERLVEPERTVMFRVPVGRRSGRRPGEPRLPRPVQQRDRALQGRAPVPSDRDARRAEVPGLRADLQEQPHRAADGRRQGRLRLRSEGAHRQRGDAVLPELHDRALPPHRREHRRARPATSTSAAARSGSCTASTGGSGSRRRHVHRARASTGAAASSVPRRPASAASTSRRRCSRPAGSDFKGLRVASRARATSRNTRR